jgi:hypothetical protein
VQGSWHGEAGFLFGDLLIRHTMLPKQLFLEATKNR